MPPVLYTLAWRRTMQVFERYPPSIILYALFAIVTTVTEGPVWGMVIALIVYFAYRVDGNM